LRLAPFIQPRDRAKQSSEKEALLPTWRWNVEKGQIAYALPALSLAYRIITAASESSTTLPIHDTIGINLLAFGVPGRPRLAIRLPCSSKKHIVALLFRFD
jgi:hypothetical protein